MAGDLFKVLFKLSWQKDATLLAKPDWLVQTKSKESLFTIDYDAINKRYRACAFCRKSLQLKKVSDESNLYNAPVEK